MIITTTIYGKPEKCRVLRDHGMGTIDVEVIRTGKFYRVSSLRRVNNA